MSSLVSIKNFSVAFGKKEVVHNISLDIQAGES
jgi:ABC-type Fe3+/spermidine/putrescine transport system ATPase subunit